MKPKEHFRNHLRSLLWKKSVREEVESELSFHVEMRTRELIGRGVNPKEARARALGRFGNINTVNRQCRRIAKGRDLKMRFKDWLDEQRQDIVFSARQMRKAPSWTLIVVSILAVGIAANAVVFSVVNAVVLRPLPLPEPDRLVRVWETTPQGDWFSVSAPNFLDWRQQNRSFTDLAAISFFPLPMLSLLGEGEPERLVGLPCTDSLFSVLGVQPLLGRTFSAEETRFGNEARALVMSHGL